MPTYRYRCGSCGEEFEVWQSINDDALTTHETCNGPLLKVFSPAGIVLKGSGFYRNDSRSGQSTNGKRDRGKESDRTKESDRSKEKESTKSDSSASSGSSDSGSSSGSDSAKSTDSSGSGSSSGGSGSPGSSDSGSKTGSSS